MKIPKVHCVRRILPILLGSQGTTKSMFSNALLLHLALFFVAQLMVVKAGELYSEQELWATGDWWKKTQAQWNVEKVRHDAAIKEIQNSDLSVVDKNLQLNQEFKLHKEQSMALARQRQQVQNILIAETNARVKGGKYQTSAEIKSTLGTGINDPGYRGMPSDFDGEAGAVTIERMKDTLKDMGLDTTLKLKDSRLTPGTVEIEGDFDVCLHKKGIAPKVGEEMHKILNQVDAKNPEIYLSERMRNRALGQKNAGTDYVEVQDHLKKARQGHVATSADLGSNEKLMTKMAKGTKKTLEIGNVSDEELRKIIKQNGIKKDGVDLTPEQFKEKIADIKEGNYVVKDSRESAKIREASKDIFHKAEHHALEQAEIDFKEKAEQLKKLNEKIEKIDAMSDLPETRARREQLKKAIQEKEFKIREELIDSKVKMDASKASNKEFFSDSPQAVQAGSDGSPKSKVDSDITDVPPTTKGTSPEVDPVKVDTNVKAPKVSSKIKTKALLALKTYGDFMDIVDIGNACKKFQEYNEGKAELKDVLRAVVDITPAGGVIGAGEKMVSSGNDYFDMSDKIRKANDWNTEAYLNQWYVGFRKAGMDKKDARKYISAAVLGGNFEILENKAELLRSEGKTIETPKLVVEENLGPDGGGDATEIAKDLTSGFFIYNVVQGIRQGHYDYMGQNAKDMATGMWKSTVEGAEYIVYAPGRVVTAWAEGELKEAVLDYNSQTATSDMRTRLFRKLLNAGISTKRALEAVNGSQSQLLAITKEAQEKMQKIREEQAKVLAKRQAFEERLNACMSEISRLRFAEAWIKTDPKSPLKIPIDSVGEGNGFPVTVSLDGELTYRVAQIARELEKLVGEAPSVQYSYDISLKSAEKLSPSSWQIEVPDEPGAYPVDINVVMSLASFPKDYKPIYRTIFRTVKGTISVTPSTETIRFSRDTYHLKSGVPASLEAVVSNQASEGHYFFNWTIDSKSNNTLVPVTTYSPEFREEECPATIQARVALCDRNSGCLIDEAEATLNISFGDINPKLALSSDRTKGTPGTLFNLEASVQPKGTYRFDWEVESLGSVLSYTGEQSDLEQTFDHEGDYRVTVKLYDMEDQYLDEGRLTLSVEPDDSKTESGGELEAESEADNNETGYWVLYDKVPINGCQFYDSECYPLESCSGGPGSFQITVGSSTCGSNASGRTGSGTYSVPPDKMAPGETLDFEVTASEDGHTTIHVTYYRDQDKISFDGKGYNLGDSPVWSKKIISCNRKNSPQQSEYVVPDHLEKGAVLLIKGGGSIGTVDTSRSYFFLYKWKE